VMATPFFSACRAFPELPDTHDVHHPKGAATQQMKRAIRKGGAM
jgi:hypothetical protein